MCTKTAQEHTHTNTARVPVPEQALQATQSLRPHHCGAPHGTPSVTEETGQKVLGTTFCVVLQLPKNLPESEKKNLF